MTIRPATPADRGAIAALHLASWQDAYRGTLSDAYLRDILPAEMVAKWAARSFSAPELTLVAEDAGALTGFVCVLVDRAPPLIDNLHVRPDLRGRGLGEGLMQAALGALRSDGYREADLTVLASNAGARAFYARLGGRDLDEVADWLIDQPVTARHIRFDLA